MTIITKMATKDDPATKEADAAASRTVTIRADGMLIDVRRVLARYRQAPPLYRHCTPRAPADVKVCRLCVCVGGGVCVCVTF